MKSLVIFLMVLVGLMVTGCGHQSAITQAVSYPTDSGEVKSSSTSISSSGFSLTITVPEPKKVDKVVPAWVWIAQETLPLKVGTNFQLDGKVIYNDDTFNDRIKWTSSDQSIVAVNEVTGLLIGVGKGETTITAYAVEDMRKSKQLKVIVVK